MCRLAPICSSDRAEEYAAAVAPSQLVSRQVSTDNRNVPLFKTLEMSSFVLVVHF